MEDVDCDECVYFPACVLACMTAVTGQDLASFEKRITVKKLPNGLTLIMCERPKAPVFSFYTLVDAGSADDPQGASGLAHMFEHMAFKGTDTVGTTNFPAEKVALAKVEIAYAAYNAEFRKRVGQDPAKLAQLKKAFDDARAEAQKYVIPNQFTEIAEQNGAVGINASTARTRRNTSGACHRTGWSCGHTSKADASDAPCSASFTRSATWCRKSAACASTPTPSAD